MKTLKKILFVLYVLMLAVITFYTFNLVCSLISNYQSVSRTTMSCIPMFMFMLICIIFLFIIFNFVVYKRRDPYFVRKYAITVGIMSLIGVIFSILCGTYVYHKFFGDYVFQAYPFVMLFVHLVFLAISIYYLVLALKDIKEIFLDSFVVALITSLIASASIKSILFPTMHKTKYEFNLCVKITFQTFYLIYTFFIIVYTLKIELWGETAIIKT